MDASPAFAAAAGFAIQCQSYGEVRDLTIEGCTFDGGAPSSTPNDGMLYGIYVASYSSYGLPTQGVTMNVVGNAIRNCRSAGFRFRGLPFTGVKDPVHSTIEISGNRFLENVAMTGVLPPHAAQIFIDMGQGKQASFAVSSNTMLHTRGSALTVINPSAGGSFGNIGSANVGLTFEGNLVEEPEQDGLHLIVSTMNLNAVVRRNRISETGGHGILNQVEYVAGTGYSSVSDPDVVNNFVVDAAGDGIRNEAVSQVGTILAPFSAAPRLTYNTVAFSGGFALRNLATYSAPYQAFFVTNSIFTDSGGPDLEPTAGLTPLTITFCNFQNPDPATIGPTNNDDPPNFVNPAPGVRDLHLASGSQLVDRGTDTPPAAPGIDFDGDLRPFDVGPTGPPNQTGDIGADERKTP